MTKLSKTKSQKYQIDQSGKIEQTQLDTVIAVVGEDKTFAVILRRSDKRILQTIFRSSQYSRFFAPLVFAATVAWLIKAAYLSGTIIIDQEYTGYEELILERISAYLKIIGFKDNVHLKFGHVGKLSKVHDFALKVAHKKKIANKILNLEEISALILTIKKDRDPDASGPRTV